MRTVGKVAVMLLGIAILAGVMAWMAGMFSATEPPGRVAPPAENVQGTRVIVEEERVALIEQSPGTMQARDETTVSSRITARIESVHVRASDSVKAGDPLITLDDRDLQARLEQAKQQAQAAEARREEARLEYERSETLFSEGAVAKAKLDSAESAYETARAEHAQAQENVTEAQAALSYAVITAPLAGRVIDRYAEPGDLATPGMILVRLYDPQSLRLEADVRESLAVDLNRGDEIQAAIDSIGVVLPAQIEEIVPHSDPASRSFIVKATLNAGKELYPGMFGRLLIPRGSEDRIYVPEKAIHRVGQLDYVLVDDDGSALRRFVRTGSTSNNKVEIRSGLSAGETIIVSAS